MLFADTDAGVRASMRATAHVWAAGAWGVLEDADVAIVPEALVRVAGSSGTMRLAVTARPSTIPSALSCHPDGLIGLDVLQHCRLVLANRGALACDPLAPGFDTAPVLAKLKRAPPPAGLAPRPLPLSPGVVASLGCDTVTNDEVARWAREEAVSLPHAQEQVLRTRAIGHAAKELNVQVSDEEVDAAMARMAVLNRLDSQAFEQELSRLGKPLAAYRAELAQKLLEQEVALVSGELRTAPSEGEIDAFVLRLRDRLTRVSTLRGENSCEESWPGYYLEQLVLVGLTPADEDLVRLALGRRLTGATVTLGAAGRLPVRLESAVAEVFRPRGLVPRMVMEEEGKVLRIRVLLEAPAQ